MTFARLNVRPLGCLWLRVTLRLLRIQLDDKHFVYRNVDHLSGLVLFDGALQSFLIYLDPLRNESAAGNLKDIFVSLRSFALLFDFYYIANLYKVGRDIYLLAIYKNMLVVNDLSSTRPASAATT